MAAIATNVRRIPGPIQALIASLIFVALGLLILRVTLNPTEEAMRASAEAARPQREAVQVRTRAPTDASTTTDSAATEDTAESGLPSVGDTLVSTDELSVTLLGVEDLSELPQLVGDPVDPRKSYFRIVTIEFENHGSDPTTVQNTNIWLVKDDGSRVVVDANSLDALISAPPLAFESRPLFLAESVPVDKSIVVSVTFDVREDETITKLDVEGLEFAMPAVNLDAAMVAETETEAEAEVQAEAEATPEVDTRDTRAGSSLDTTENRGRARIEAVEQVAESRTGLPTVGDALLGADGLEVVLVSVQRFEQLTQVHGTPFRPKNGLFQLVTITFNNTNDSGNIVVSKANIYLLEPDGNEIAVDSPGVNALIGMATTATEGRPLFLVESVPNGKSATVAVVFDVDPGLVDLLIDIEGFQFEIPNP